MKTIATLLIIATSLAAAADITVYIGTGEKGIYSTTMNQEKGTLTEPVLAAEVASSGFLTKHPNKPILYSTAETKSKTGLVVAYSINDDGKLTELNQQPANGARLAHISLDATSNMLLGANYRGGYAISYPISPDGSIGKFASQHLHKGSSVNPKRQSAPHAHSIYSGPDNKFAYAPDLGIDKVVIYKINPDKATLTPAGFATSPAGAGPRHMKFGKNGKQAYVLNELTLSISVYDRNPSTGQLTPTQLLSTLPEGADKNKRSCSEIKVSNNGRYIYCANRDLSDQGRDSISVFSVGEKGKLTRIQTIAAESWVPRHINLDPSGQWLLVAGMKSHNIPVFKIDQKSGKLSFTGRKINVPKAMCIEFSAK